MTLELIDQQGFGKRLKSLLPDSLFRPLSVIFNGLAGALPYGLKYSIGSRLRARKYPYCLIENGDVIVQVGAPRDLLKSGRSRAIHFARQIGGGQVIVIEPDPENLKALKSFIRRNNLDSRVTVFECGAWNEPSTLSFYSSKSHPASNVLEGIKDIPEEIIEMRGYLKTLVPVRTIDDILSETALRSPKLVSITTNGAEVQILEGMRRTIAKNCRYISLAETGKGYVDHMETLGYRCLVRDDRGYCFEKAID